MLESQLCHLESLFSAVFRSIFGEAANEKLFSFSFPKKSLFPPLSRKTFWPDLELEVSNVSSPGSEDTVPQAALEESAISLTTVPADDTNPTSLVYFQIYLCLWCSAGFLCLTSHKLSFCLSCLRFLFHSESVDFFHHF